MKGQQNLKQIVSQQKPSAVRSSLVAKQIQKIEGQKKPEVYTPSPAYLEMKSFTQQFLKKIEKLQAEHPQQGIVLHLQIMKDYSKYSKSFKKLSLEEMDKVISLLKKVYAKGLPKTLGTYMTLKVQIKFLSQIRESEARNILSIIKRAAVSIFKCLPSYGRSKDLEVHSQNTESSISKEGESNPDLEQKQRLINK